MTFRTQEPVVTIDKHDGSERIEHPAYGLVGAARVVCAGGIALAGSDLRHDRFVELSISTAHNSRRHSTDHYHGDNTIIKVQLSEAQWATFVSSMNVGDGVPCTISFRQNEYVPALPMPRPTHSFRRDMAADIAEATAAMRDLKALLSDPETRMPKGARDKLRDLAEKAERAVRSSAPFVARRFDEHMEEMVEAAKSEVHAHALHTALRMGLSSGEVENPIAIESDNKED